MLLPIGADSSYAETAPSKGDVTSLSQPWKDRSLMSPQEGAIRISMASLLSAGLKASAGKPLQLLTATHLAPHTYEGRAKITTYLVKNT